MPRPRIYRRIRCRLRACYFKPVGTPLRFLEVIELTKEEVEALRLKHLLDLEQIEAAKKWEFLSQLFKGHSNLLIEKLLRL